METRSTFSRLAFWLTLFCGIVAFHGLSAQAWSKKVTFSFPDSEGGPPATGSFNVTANQMTSPSDPGKPITDPNKVIFNGDSLGYIKLRLDGLVWDSESASTDDEAGAEYLLFVHSNWVDSDPAIYPDPKKKRKFIIAPNTEFTSSMSRPPSITFIVSNSGTYTFKIGYRVTTPFTKENKVTYERFTFTLSGIKGKRIVTSAPIKTTVETPAVTNTEPEDDNRLDALFARAEKGKSPKMFLDYYRRSDDPVKKKKVEDYLVTRFQIEKKEDLFTIQFILDNLDGVRLPPGLIKIDSITAENGTLTTAPTKTFDREAMIMKLIDSTTTHLVYARDALGRPFSEPIKLVPGADLKAWVTENDEKGMAELKILGGTMPYSVTFYTASAGGKDTLHLKNQVYTPITNYIKENLSVSLPVKIAGIYKVEVGDDNGYVSTAQGTMFLTPPPKPPYAWLAIGGLVLIAGGIVFWQWQKKQQENREMEVLLEQKKYEKTIRRKQKITPEMAAAALVAEEGGGGAASSVEEYKTIEVDLDAVWRDSVTSTVILTEDFQRSMEDFEKEYKEIEQQEWFIPPGGFLLGEVGFSEETEAYELTLKEIVPYQELTVAQEDLMFGTDGWQELKDVAKEHYGVKVLGWYHIKVGNALDLTPNDVRIHSVYFREPYQLVMVKAEETQNIGFISRKITGRMNNVQDTQEGSSWLQLERKEAVV